MRAVIRHLRRAALLQAGESLTDGQLLEAFVGQREEAAFEALLRRHGPMVLGVCRRVLASPDDVDDAFQATFLVLVRKAATLRPRELVGHWLYGVAFRTAMKARTMNARRRAKEKGAGERSRPEPPADEVPAELLAQLDAELNRLPDKYRVPLVLCELEGKGRKEVAKLLGLPEGTLSWRLAHAKKMLAQRLSRRGVDLSGGALAAVLCRSSVPHPLLTSTAKAGMAVAAGQAVTGGTVSAKVLALAEGVMKAMLLAKLKVAAWVVLLAVCVGGGAAYRAAAQGPVQGRFVVTDGAGRNTPDDLEAIRLEMEALRKEVRALRERVRTLEAQAAAPKGGETPRRAGEQQADVVLKHLITGKQNADVAFRPGITGGVTYYFKFADPLADAEAALKKLRANPNDKHAADALEQALKRLKEQRTPNQPEKPDPSRRER
jgi:RNA polymerase sigma factor (sigma-70 family)